MEFFLFPSSEGDEGGCDEPIPHGLRVRQLYHTGGTQSYTKPDGNYASGLLCFSYEIPLCLKLNVVKFSLWKYPISKINYDLFQLWSFPIPKPQRR